MNNGRLHVLLVGGSRAEPSRSGALLRAVERQVAVRNASTCRWDIARRPLEPIVPGAEPPQEAVQLATLARAADALVIVSPLYHNSYSGAVKDVLDHLTRRDVERKPIALLSNSGGMPSTQALDHLRDVVRALLGIAVPRQVVTVDADYELDGDHYRLVDPAIELRLSALADELLWLAARLRQGADAAAPTARRERVRA
jgi:azobenzene reductase